MTPSLESVDHVHVHVADRAAAERWYAEVLGFKRLAAVEFWATEDGPLMIANASGTIQLALFERPPGTSRSTIAMAASGEEFLAWREHLSEALGRRLDPVDHELSWSIYFNDPDGNPFEITSYDYESLAAELR